MRTTEFFKAFLLVDFKEDTQKSIRIVFSDPLKHAINVTTHS